MSAGADLNRSNLSLTSPSAISALLATRNQRGVRLVHDMAVTLPLRLFSARSIWARAGKNTVFALMGSTLP